MTTLEQQTMTTDQTAPQPEQNAETGGPVQAFVGWISEGRPTEWAIKHVPLHDSCYEVLVLADGEESSSYYVAFSLDGPNGDDTDAIAAVTEQYCGDWQFSARQV